MKKEFPFDNLYEVMLQYLAPLYFPQSFDDDTIHTLAREEFFRVQGIICREYEFDEDKYIEEYNGFSPFDEVSDDIEQEVYARIRKDSRLLQIVRIRKETIALIRKAVKKQMESSVHFTPTGVSVIVMPILRKSIKTHQL